MYYSLGTSSFLLFIFCFPKYQFISNMDLVIHISHPRTWEKETGMFQVQGQPQQHDEFQASLGYMRLCLKNT